MPTTKARVKLILEAEVDLDPSSELTDEEQLDDILKRLADNPQQFNRLEAKQTLQGEVYQGE